MSQKIDIGNGRSIEIGELLLDWRAYDHHPHERGWIWMSLFCLVFFGGAVWSIWSDPVWGWVTAISFFIAAAVFFSVHRKGHEEHRVRLFEKCLTIDDHTLYTWDSFDGYWFVYDETVSVVNFEFSKKKNQKMTLQMGDLIPDDIRSILEEIEVEELVDKEESLLDLWSRALKL